MKTVASSAQMILTAISRTSAHREPDAHGDACAQGDGDRDQARFDRADDAGKQIAAELTAMGAEQPCELFQVKYMPTAEDMKRMFENGEKLGRLLLERVK